VSTQVAAKDADSAAAHAAPTAAEVADWIAQLDDNRYFVREQATRQLLDAGVAVLDPLLTAANGDRLEPADRAVWIMRRLGRSADNDQAIAALERMTQLRGRPHVVERAENDLVEAYQKRLAALGAEIIVEPAQFEIANIVSAARRKMARNNLRSPMPQPTAAATSFSTRG
jgi:hypothetical protein